MSTRRRFIALMPWAPLAGASLLAACSDKAPPPSASPAPAPAPAPSPPPAEPAAAATPAATGTPTLVSPSDPQARTLGYVPLSSQADSAKYKTHTADQSCSNCALYAGKAGDPSGPCPLFAGRLVNAQGWCSAYAKKG